MWLFCSGAQKIIMAYQLHSESIFSFLFFSSLKKVKLPFSSPLEAFSQKQINITHRLRLGTIHNKGAGGRQWCRSLQPHEESLFCLKKQICTSCPLSWSCCIEHHHMNAMAKELQIKSHPKNQLWRSSAFAHDPPGSRWRRACREPSYPWKRLWERRFGSTELPAAEQQSSDQVWEVCTMWWPKGSLCCEEQEELAAQSQ